MLFFAYQGIYVVVVLIKRPKKMMANRNHRLAVLCSARNEETVIADLIDSVHNQDYPQDLVSVFVVADNCTDRTAEIARRAGAEVWERCDQQKKGKGYAIDFLFQRIFEKYSEDAFDAYLIFDADNLLKKNYLSEMNASLCEGYEIVTSCRNSKNYADNWISAGYGLWFLRESKFLNEARMTCHTSAVVAGTGFMVSKKIIKENNGWPYHMLSEDTEFSVDQIIKGRKIAYCADAVFYDEQPTDFKQSLQQRLRWIRGFYQVFGKYGTSLLDAGFSGYDIFMTNLPALFLTLLGLVFNVSAVVMSLFGPPIIRLYALKQLLTFVAGSYFSLLLISGATLVVMWSEIKAPATRKIAYLFLCPIFILSYIPVALKAMKKTNVEWVQITHHKKSI